MDALTCVTCRAGSLGRGAGLAANGGRSGRGFVGATTAAGASPCSSLASWDGLGNMSSKCDMTNNCVLVGGSGSLSGKHDACGFLTEAGLSGRWQVVVLRRCGGRKCGFCTLAVGVSGLACLKVGAGAGVGRRGVTRSGLYGEAKLGLLAETLTGRARFEALVVSCRAFRVVACWPGGSFGVRCFGGRGGGITRLLGGEGFGDCTGLLTGVVFVTGDTSASLGAGLGVVKMAFSCPGTLGAGVPCCCGLTGVFASVSLASSLWAAVTGPA